MAKGQLAPFTQVQCPEESGAAVRPGVNLYARRSAIPTHRITYENGRFHIYEVGAEGNFSLYKTALPRGIRAMVGKLAKKLRAEATS